MTNSNRKPLGWIDGFLKYTENTESPRMYRKWTAISLIASALQRKCYIEWGVGLTWYPNLYIVLVGPSSARKGTAMGPGLGIIESIGTIKVAAHSTSREALIRRLKTTNHNDIDPVTGKTVYHSSMTIFSKEFTVFLGYHNSPLMAALCDWYDCDDRWSYETISRDKEEIIGVWVNLIAATTPLLLRSAMPMEMIGGGLSSRTVYIYEEAKGKCVPCPIMTDEERKLRTALQYDMERISLLAGQFHATDEFIKAWVDWYHYNDSNPPALGTLLQSYIGRRQTHLMKVAMIICASRLKPNNPMVLEMDDLEAAIEILEEAEVKMPHTFRGIGQSPTADLLQQVMTYVLSSKTDQILLSQFAIHFQNDMDKYTMDKMIGTLEVMNKVKLVHRPGSESYIKILR